jgi:hypothetical protein
MKCSYSHRIIKVFIWIHIRESMFHFVKYNITTTSKWFGYDPLTKQWHGFRVVTMIMGNWNGIKRKSWFQTHVSKVQILYPHIFYYHLDTSLAIKKCKVKKCQTIWHKIRLLHFVNLWSNNKIRWNKWNQSEVNKNNNNSLNMQIVKQKYFHIESICIHTHKYSS